MDGVCVRGAVCDYQLSFFFLFVGGFSFLWFEFSVSSFGFENGVSHLLFGCSQTICKKNSKVEANGNGGGGSAMMAVLESKLLGR